MRETIFRNARLVLADEVVHGDLCVRDGRIVDCGPGGTHGPAGEDLEGDHLLPGLVELHTDHLESHYAPRSSVRWDPLAAVQAHDAQVAGCGITTVFDALRAGTDDEPDQLGRDMGALAAAIGRGRAEDRLRAEHFIHLRCEISGPHVVDEVTPYLDNELVRLVSLMDHTPGQRQFLDLAQYRQFYQRKLGLDEAGIDAFVAERLERHRRYAPANRAAVVARCRAAGLCVASHDDATVEHVAEAAESGVTISEFPTTREAAVAARRRGLQVLMGAPNVVRGGSHTGNVAAVDLAAEGLLDILSSDYVPISLVTATFRLPELVPGLSLPAAVAFVTRRPAEAVGLTDRGEIAGGRRADLIRVRNAGGLPALRGVWRSGQRVA